MKLGIIVLSFIVAVAISALCWRDVDRANNIQERGSAYGFRPLFPLPHLFRFEAVIGTFGPAYGVAILLLGIAVGVFIF